MPRRRDKRFKHVVDPLHGVTCWYKDIPICHICMNPKFKGTRFAIYLNVSHADVTFESSMFGWGMWDHFYHKNTHQPYPHALHMYAVKIANKWIDPPIHIRVETKGIIDVYRIKAMRTSIRMASAEYVQHGETGTPLG